MKLHLQIRRWEGQSAFSVVSFILILAITIAMLDVYE